VASACLLFRNCEKEQFRLMLTAFRTSVWIVHPHAVGSADLMAMVLGTFDPFGTIVAWPVLRQPHKRPGQDFSVHSLVSNALRRNCGLCANRFVRSLVMSAASLVLYSVISLRRSCSPISRGRHRCCLSGEQRLRHMRHGSGLDAPTGIGHAAAVAASDPWHVVLDISRQNCTRAL
jgi:hypothetical protein